MMMMKFQCTTFLKVSYSVTKIFVFIFFCFVIILQCGEWIDHVILSYYMWSWVLLKSEFKTEAVIVIYAWFFLLYFLWIIWLSLTVQLTAWKALSLKWLLMCWVGLKLYFLTHPISHLMCRLPIFCRGWKCPSFHLWRLLHNIAQSSHSWSYLFFSVISTCTINVFRLCPPVP